MGLFDALLNKGAKMLKQAATEAMENAAEEIFSGLKETGGSTASASTSRTSTSQEGTSRVNTPSGYEALEGEMVDDKLRSILAKEFAQYEVKEQVSPTTLGGTGKFLPYDFGIYENGVPKLFIMVVYNNTCAHRDYRWSKEEAARAGVPMINFVYAFENKIDYIINRLHQYL
ncbi:MAG: hypothetical protein IJN16_05485 [Lachnospiraceae bacterium]|nr:hypothetical protein [Lachnospiraceae bacterium]